MIVEGFEETATHTGTSRRERSKRDGRWTIRLIEGREEEQRSARWKIHIAAETQSQPPHMEGSWSLHHVPRWETVSGKRATTHLLR
jgi:hypothetical protein